MEQYRLLAECLLPAHIISLNQECARISLQFTEHKKEEAPPPKKKRSEVEPGISMPVCEEAYSSTYLFVLP